MTQAVRYEAVIVKDWVAEGNKIYLLTESGKKYRYAGPRKVDQIKMDMPKGTGLYVGIVLNGKRELLVDDKISRC